MLQHIDFSLVISVCDTGFWRRLHQLQRDRNLELIIRLLNR